MWELANRTPFAAERGWVRDRDGAEVWLVAVKATFDIKPGGTTAISADQPPVLRVPQYHDGPAGSVKYDVDLVLTKPTTDVLVVGHACAPEGQLVTQMDVGVRVGELTKVLRVFGDRRWGSFGASAPEAFAKLPIVYERSFGGVDPRSKRPDRDWDWRNPIGVGFCVAGAHADGMKLPNIEYPGELIGSWKDRPSPAGFGAVSSHWQPRAALAGTYGEEWEKTRKPLLAQDLDDLFFQCAPSDQQTRSFLHGGEQIVVHGMNPSGSLHFLLPRIHLGFETTFADGSRELHHKRSLHTVVIEPDVPRVSCVWHSSLRCHSRVQKLTRTIVRLKADAGLGEPALRDGRSGS